MALLFVAALLVLLCRAAPQQERSAAESDPDPHAHSKQTLYFSFITAINGSTSSAGGVPIVDYAIEQINRDERVLPNYTLQHTQVLNSQCKSISALESFLHHFDNQAQPTYVSLMCCGCSPATIPVAEISHHWNVPQISFASSATTLNDRKRFKKLFRTLPCHVYDAPSIAGMMKEFKWSQMAMITQNESPFSTSANAMRVIFEKQQWKLDQTANIEPGDDSVQYENLFQWEDDYRIIMVNTFESHAYHIVCEAFIKYGKRLVEQEIVLILHGRYPKEWWETAHETVGKASRCSRDEVMKALNKTFALTPVTYNLMDDPTAQTFSQSTPHEIEVKYEELMKMPEYSNYTSLNFYGNAYDSVWAMAVGLDIADRRARAGDDRGCEELEGELVPLSMFNYTNSKMGCMMKNGYASVNFTGITGHIMFEPDGARPENVIRLRQSRVSKHGDKYLVDRPTVAKIVNEEDYDRGDEEFGDVEIVFEDGESYETIWPDGIPPYDGSPERVVENNPLALTIVLCIIAAVGLVFTAICFAFNTIFRNKPVVKLSSPNLNYLVVAGAAMLYISVCFYSYSASSELHETILCNCRFWLFSIGYTMCFSVILSKQWRVYCIFSNPKPNQRLIKDWLLFVIVGGLVVVDAFILLVGTAVPVSRLEAMITEEEEMRVSGDGINEIVQFYTCSNQDAIIWISVSFAYKVLLQLFGIFMAFSTRKVYIKALNDTTVNYLIIYINSIILTLLIVTEYALKSHPLVYTVLYGSAVFVESSLFLGLVFIPKAVLLYIDPDGNKTVFVTSKHPTVVSMNNTLDGEKMSAPLIKAKMAELQKMLTQIENVSADHTPDPQNGNC